MATSQNACLLSRFIKSSQLFRIEDLVRFYFLEYFVWCNAGVRPRVRKPGGSLASTRLRILDDVSLFRGFKTKFEKQCTPCRITNAIQSVTLNAKVSRSHATINTHTPTTRDPPLWFFASRCYAVSTDFSLFNTFQYRHLRSSHWSWRTALQERPQFRAWAGNGPRSYRRPTS
ncbi:hypothetical protein EJ02DRAFT_230127 [Clathrospora elynae]|uniref:Uncharacterized protein n=1 Tax=Clathrospora elynae TaxID=706981 RepID=A0A6A5SL85_9PLEO|nr:hypothetical protein EJ02DRAFT_230127 [Clathrospora elynae]